MKNNKGFISIFTLIVVSVVLIVSVFVFYLSYMNSLIINADISKKQAFYLAEEKIYLCLYKDEYLYNELIPKIKYNLTTRSLKKDKRRKIINIKKSDLNEQDDNNQIKLEFFKEKGILKANLLTSSTYNGIKKHVVGTINIVNYFYEKGLGILCDVFLNAKEQKDFNEFIFCLIQEMQLPKTSKSMTNIELEGYEKIYLSQNPKLNKYMVYSYKVREDSLCREIPLKDNKLFLILKNFGYKPCLHIDSPTFDERDNIVEGIIYVEGDLILYDNVQFYGIIILENGSIITKGSKKPKIDGLLILNNYRGDETKIDEMIDINYDRDIIYKYGILLPNFIDPKLYLIKDTGY